jgi:hypothetical protein
MSASHVDAEFAALNAVESWLARRKLFLRRGTPALIEGTSALLFLGRPK